MTTKGDKEKRKLLIETGFLSKLNYMWAQGLLCDSEESLKNLIWCISNIIDPEPDLHII